MKKSAPKQNKPGNWRDGSVIDGTCCAVDSRLHSSRAQLLTLGKSADDKKKGTDTPSTSSVPASPGPIVNQLDDSAKETFPTGRPLEDKPKIQQCKHCKKSILSTAINAHLISCLKAKKEKAQRKKEQKEAREREKKGMDGDKKDDDGDTRMEDDDDAEEDASPEKKGPGGLKSTKKSAGKKIEIDDTKKGKKRKADGDAEKGPKQKKKKEEPKPKAPKPKGIYLPNLLSSTPENISISPFYFAHGFPEDNKAIPGFVSAPGARTSPGWDAFFYSPSKKPGKRPRWFSPRRARRRPLPASSPTPQTRSGNVARISPSTRPGVSTHFTGAKRPQTYLTKELKTTIARIDFSRTLPLIELGDEYQSTASSTILIDERTKAPQTQEHPSTRSLPKPTRKERSDSTNTSPSKKPEVECQIPLPGDEPTSTSPLRDLDSDYQSSPPSKNPEVRHTSLSQFKRPRQRSKRYSLPMPPPNIRRTYGRKGIPQLRLPVSQASQETPFIIYNPELPANSLFQGPVDVERQCGVIIKDGVQCARSLTCKSHSMGAKRAVPGRSLPYDMLLAAYQKKNQAKQQSMHFSVHFISV